ncbi:MAG: hypothetical protein AB7S38_42915 [Vulcanimicrobiota bacterium]
MVNTTLMPYVPGRVQLPGQPEQFPVIAPSFPGGPDEVVRVPTELPIAIPRQPVTLPTIAPEIPVECPQPAGPFPIETPIELPHYDRGAWVDFPGQLPQPEGDQPGWFIAKF